MGLFGAQELDLSKAVNQTRGGSDRVFRCKETSQEAKISDWAGALARKFERNEKSVTIAINNAARGGKPVFGLTFELVSGKPLGEAKPRGPRAVANKPKNKKAA